MDAAVLGDRLSERTQKPLLGRCSGRHWESSKVLAGLAFCEMLSQYPRSAFRGSAGVMRGGQQQIATQTLCVHLLGIEGTTLTTKAPPFNCRKRLWLQPSSFKHRGSRGSPKRWPNIGSPYRYVSLLTRGRLNIHIPLFSISLQVSDCALRITLGIAVTLECTSCWIIVTDQNSMPLKEFQLTGAISPQEFSIVLLQSLLQEVFLRNLLNLMVSTSGGSHYNVTTIMVTVEVTQ